MNPQLFGQNLGQWLKTEGMTQTEFAKQSGLTHSAVSRIIALKRKPNLPTICRILSVVGMSFETLVTVRPDVTEGTTP